MLTPLIQPFLVLAEQDAVWWKSLVLRAGFTLLLLFPYGYRFVPVSFRAQDIDPVLLEACQAEGLDILNPATWMSLGQVWRRWALAVILAVLAWWLLSRILRWLRQRSLLGVVLGLLVAGAILPWRTGMIEGFLFQLGWRSVGNPLAVWGGWMHGAVFDIEGMGLALGRLILALAMLEGLLALLATQARLAEAKALALRAHLAPHFLYNALNTVQGLVDEDPKGAQAGLERLGRLLRRLTEASRAAQVSLAEELAFVEDYLGLQRARLGERLRVRVEVPEELTSCAVPVLGLQVLVENAVQHAIAPRAEGGELRICAEREGRFLRLSVEDPGSGASGTPGLGTALDNLRRRLAKPSDLRLDVLPTGHRASFRVRCEVA